MRLAALLAALVMTALVMTACEPPEPPPGRSSAPIVGGTRELGEDAVVEVSSFGGLCTGTLISPHVVLTAKHCVQGSGADHPRPVTTFTVGVGNSSRDTVNYRVRYVETTPGIYTSNPTTGLSGAIFGIDIGVLILREPIEGVTPIPIRRDRPDDMLGQEFTAIGFGQRPDGGSGLKYKGIGTVASVTDGVIFSQQIICPGDSGGPMIQEMPERRVIGVASFGQADSCPSARDGYNAVFNNLDLIDRAVVLAGDCLGLEEACNSIDDDCDGAIDEGCASLGESCEASADCAYSQLPGFLAPLASPVECLDLGEGPICTRSCDPMLPRTSCASLEGFDGADVPIEGYYCRRDGCEGRCAPGGAGTAPDGTRCAADTECTSLLCVDPGDDVQRCLPSCRAGFGECPVDEVCVASATGCGACVDGSIVSGGRGFGEPCATDPDCAAEGMCLESYCTAPCGVATPCVEGYRCSAGLCRRGALGGHGDPCADNSDCEGGLFCADQAGRRWCTGFCADASECAEGMDCVETGGGRICSPTGQLLGEACSGGTCVAGACEAERCTRACGAGEVCPLGFECRRDVAGNARCLAVETGGCSVRPGRSAPGWAWLAFPMVLLFRRRR